jgi:ABC-type lipoprotein release transport system permease subunit
MREWVAGLVGVVAGASVLVAVLGLLASLPVVLWRMLQVLANREWVPFSYNWRSLVRRNVTTLATLFGLVLVVFVLTSVLMFAEGIQSTLAATGRPVNVKVFRKSVSKESQSWVTEQQLQMLLAAEGVARDGLGKPLASPELLVLIWANHAGTTDPDAGANLSLRGVHPEAFVLNPPRSLQGRRFATGRDEIIIGKALVERFEGARLGSSMSFAGRQWRVVGVMDHGGTAHDSEVWGEFELMAGTFRRGVVSVNLVVRDEDGFRALSRRLSNDPQLNELRARRETEYWRSLGGNYVEFVQILGTAVGVIFSFGAILGAMNTMYAQVSARARELGTLRAIGFKPRAVLTSMVIESMMLAFVAGVIGVAAASALGNFQFKLTTVATLTEITYAFHLSPKIAFGCVGFAVLMGYAGGLLPALRASRMRILDAVRAD